MSRLEVSWSMDGVLIAPTEPAAIKALGSSSSVAERYGSDVLWGCPAGLCGVQRKEISDLVASMRDGRLSKEVAQMQGLTGVRAVIVEGRPRWTDEGELLSTHTRVTRRQLRGFLWGIRSRGVWVDWSDDPTDTAALVTQLHAWSQKARHESLVAAGAPNGDGWGQVSNDDYAKHLLTALPGIGPELASRILDHFGGVPMSWDVDEADLRQVSGLGQVTAKRLIRALARDRHKETT